MRHHMRVRFDLLQEAEIFQPGDDLLAGRKTIDPVQFFRKLRGAFGQSAQIILVIDEGERTLSIEHADLRQAVPLADFKIVEVMGRRDLDRAGAFFRIGVIVADDRDAAADQRKNDMLADQMAEALVLRMHRNRGVAEHGFGTCGRDHDEGRGIVGVEALALDRIAQIPEVALDLGLLHFEVGDRGEQLWVPIHQPLVFVDQAFAVQFDEHLCNRARQALVHRKAFARPVAGCAKPLQLVDDDAATFRLPLPDPLEEFGAAHVATARLLPFHQLPFDHHLGRDPRVIRARLPQHVASAHPLEPAENVLQRVVQRMPHVQRARHVRRRDHDGEGVGVPPLRAASLECAALLPDPGHAAFDIGGLVVFFDHDNANGSKETARKPPDRAKSTCKFNLQGNLQVNRETRQNAIKPVWVAESGPDAALGGP